MTEAITRAQSLVIEDLNKIAKQLRSFYPFVIASELRLIVPHFSYPKYDQLKDMAECCGLDADLWHEEQGYYVLQHPEA